MNERANDQGTVTGKAVGTMMGIGGSIALAGAGMLMARGAIKGAPGLIKKTGKAIKENVDLAKSGVKNIKKSGGLLTPDDMDISKIKIPKAETISRNADLARIKRGSNTIVSGVNSKGNFNGPSQISLSNTSRKPFKAKSNDNAQKILETYRNEV